MIPVYVEKNSSQAVCPIAALIKNSGVMGAAAGVGGPVENQRV